MSIPALAWVIFAAIGVLLVLAALVYLDLIGAEGLQSLRRPARSNAEVNLPSRLPTEQRQLSNAQV